MDLITSGTTVINNTFFKKRRAHGQRLAAELRGYDAIFPEKVNVRKIDAGDTLVLVSGENALVINGDKALKIRPEFADITGEVFKNIDSLRAADGKKNNIAKLRAVFSVKVGDVAQAVD